MNALGSNLKNLLIRFALVASCCACSSHALADAAASNAVDAPDTAHWRSVAQTELDATRKAILDAHPGMIDAQNPTFAAVEAANYDKAQALVSKAFDFDSALAVAGYYAAHFRDGHLSYVREVWDKGPSPFSGWVLDEVDGKYVVAATADDWPVPLPPAGSVLLACDGRPAELIVKEDVAGFWSLRDDPAIMQQVARLASRMYPGVEPWRRCRFQDTAGNEFELDITYRPITASAYQALMGKVPRQQFARRNDFNFQDGILWIHAANFNLQPSDAVQLDTMLQNLAKLKGVHSIVFDTRGNGGGDSGVGDRIFDAATGGLRFDQHGIDKLPATYAQWRISDILIKQMQDTLARKSQLYGSAAPQTQQVQTFLDAMNAARLDGKPWYDQDGGKRITREEVVRRHGKMAHFSGKLVLITDSHCASACLDFADKIHLVPGAIQVGATTSSDTNYLEVGLVRLPSGNRLALPLKVWRNRVRGSDQPWVPDVKFDFDMADDERVRAATVATLKKM